MSDFISQLHQEIAAVCPIDGVAIGRADDKSTWRIDFRDVATKPERDAAQVVVDKFVVVIAETNTEAVSKLNQIDPDSIRSMRAIIVDLYARTKQLEIDAGKAKPDPIELQFLLDFENQALAERAKLKDPTP